MRVLVIDELEVVYRGVESYFSVNCESSRFLWAINPREAQSTISKNGIDLIVSELDFQELDGLESLEWFHRRYGIQSVVYTSIKNAFRVKWLTGKNFIKNIVFKEAGMTPILEAVCKEDSEKVLDTQMHLEASGLSKREEEVLNFILDGFNNKSISQRLELSERTVATYKHRLFKKLGLQNNFELFSTFAKSRDLVEMSL